MPLRDEGSADRENFTPMQSRTCSIAQPAAARSPALSAATMLVIIASINSSIAAPR